jgi:abortive infection bacteriophage resistance protein
MKFSKPAKNSEELYAILLDRGLIIKDSIRFQKYLRTIGYYRLSGYMYPLQASNGTHRFKENVSFDTILNHYLFDKKLRLLLLHEIEKIEIAFRSIVCNTYALKFGAHWYLDHEHFNDKNRHESLITDITAYCQDTSDLFIKNYNFKYSDPALPAAWMVFEIFIFGQLSSLFENLKDTEEKKSISKQFGSQVVIFQSWIKSINYVRNCCAHHARVWNKKIPLKPMIPQRKQNRFLNHIDEETNKRMFGIISCMLHLVNSISAGSHFKNRVKELFDEFPEINKDYMGFIKGWENEPLWK